MVSRIRNHPAAFSESYSERRVNSIYFDTPGFMNLVDATEGIGERSKIRLRWYGPLARIPGVTVEWKRKRSNVSWKVSESLPGFSRTFEECFWADIREELMTNVQPELIARLATNFVPVVMVSYLRRYFETLDESIRVTVDSDISAYSQTITAGPTLRFPIAIAPLTILELKASVQNAEAVRRVSKDLPMSIGRSSKYAVAAEAALLY